MSAENFPTHYDGQLVNAVGEVPVTLPIEVSLGKCSYTIHQDHVEIINENERSDEDPVMWQEPLSAYRGLRQWIVGLSTPAQPGLFGHLRPLFGSVKSAEPPEARRLVVALVHDRDPWMSIVLHARALTQDEAVDDEPLLQAYGDLLGVAIES